MKYFVLIVSLILLLFVACDRFEHSFEQQDEQLPINDFFSDFSDSLAAKNVAGILEFYCDDYSNNGILKEQVEEFYTNLFASDYSLESTLIDTTNYPEVSWKLTINNEQNELVSDSLIVDYLISKNARYLFNGNQADMRNVLVELFTATWCPNCPYAEDALHNLHEEYGNRFIYFEYHINDALQIPGNSDILNYYGESSLPVTVVNGNALVMSGAGPTIEHTIDSAIQPLLSEQAKAQICLNEMAINNNVLNVQIQMNIQNDVSLSELYLKYVVVEDYDEVNTNVNGDHLHNVVKYKNEISLADYVNQQPLDIIIEAIETYPQDSSIIFWIQTMESPYNESTCQVYNVIKKRIE